MKTILIEQVSNGWIVRPFQPFLTRGDRPAIAVFINMADLQAALPELLSLPLPLGATATKDYYA